MNDALKGHFTDFPIKLLLFKPDATTETLGGRRASWLTDSVVSLAVAVVKLPGAKQVKNF